MKHPVDSHTQDKRVEFEAAVATVPVLQALFKAFPEQLEQSLRWDVHAPGTVLITRGTDVDDVFFLSSGKALAVNAADAPQGVIFENLDTGDIFGEMAAFDSGPCPTEVVTTSVCRVGRMPGKVFMALVLSHENSNRQVLRWLGGKVRRAYLRIESLCTLTAEQRICRELVQRAVADPADSRRVRVFPVPTQQEIANTVGTTRQTVARVFGKLIRDQIIERRGQVLLCLDPARLNAAAQPQKAT
jgi:CRP-like cAMP-binding protein